MATKRVLVDCDPAIGVKLRDVDDGLAILLLLASPEISLEGITVTFGNVKAPIGYRIANEVVEVAGTQTPVHLGAHSREDLGKITPAVEFLINTVNGSPGEISLVAIGPLTNVATAMMVDEKFASNLKELVVMGGTFDFPLFSFFGELNFHLDGTAASRVMLEPIPKTLITMDLCTQAVFQDRHLQRLQAGSSQVAQYLSKGIAPWLSTNKKVFFRKKGFFPWDPIAAACLLRPELFDRNPYQFSVSETGWRSGRMLNPKRLESFDVTDGMVPVNIPLRIDGEGFLNLLVDRLLSM